MPRVCSSSRVPASVSTTPRPLRSNKFWPQLDFQLPHLAAQRRLHHGQKGGGAGEAAEFRDVAEVLELFQIHARLSCCYADLL